MKSTFTILSAAFAVLIFGSGCAHMNSVSLTPIPSQRSHVVKAEVSKTIFLDFNFDNDFINTLVEDLKGQCPNGVVSGILTKDETIGYLIIFKKHVTATGFCSIAKTASAGSTNRKRHPSSEVPATDQNPESAL